MLYTGVTNALERRVSEHCNRRCEGFTKRYRLTRLIYHETYHRIEDALARETEIKGWRRSKKNALVERINPGWCDLFVDLFGRS